MLDFALHAERTLIVIQSAHRGNVCIQQDMMVHVILTHLFSRAEELRTLLCPAEKMCQYDVDHHILLDTHIPSVCTLNNYERPLRL